MRFLKVIIAICALMISPLAIAQNNFVSGMIVEIGQAQKILNDRYDLQPAQSLLTEVFEQEGIEYSLRHTSSWGGGLWTYWRPLNGLYLDTQRRLRLWKSAIDNGLVEVEQAMTVLQPALAAFRNIDQQVPAWLDSEVENYVERARWMDQANAKGCCEPLYYRFIRLADAALQDPFRPDFSYIGSMVLVPPVPPPGQAPQDVQRQALDRLTARIATYGQNPVYLQALIAEARLHLMIYPSSETDQLDVLLRLLNERLSLQQRPVTEILALAESTPPGALRDSLLDEAHDAVLDRATHLMPMLASDADNASNMSELSRLLDAARRVVSLRDDVRNPLRSTSALLRFMSALNASATLLDVQQRGSVQARDINSFVSDIGTSLGPNIPVTAPYAAPLGAISGLLNRISAAAAATSNGLNGITDAINGDPAGISRARIAAQSVKALLEPRAIIADMAKGAFEGIVSNVPFARSLLKLFMD